MPPAPLGPSGDELHAVLAARTINVNARPKIGM
jgi:hypothetical protein